MTGEQQLKRAQARVFVALGFMGLMCLLAVLVLVSLFLPYAPLTIHSYEASKRELCPQELTSVTVDYSVMHPPGIRRIEVEPAWVAEDVAGLERGQRIESADSTPVTYPTTAGRRTVQSNVLRVAPIQPGEWRVAGELTVYGNAYGTPRVQVLTPQARGITTVLPPDAPECEGAP
jgi:hypothetical protein